MQTPGNQPVHIHLIKHKMSSVLNGYEQKSGLSVNSKKSFNTETLADNSLDTLDNNYSKSNCNNRV